MAAGVAGDRRPAVLAGIAAQRAGAHDALARLAETLVALANADQVYKVGPRDVATVMAKKAHGGTTVAGTMLACQQAGIQVFATGGIVAFVVGRW
mgnify:CR=1 FL=1